MSDTRHTLHEMSMNSVRYSRAVNEFGDLVALGSSRRWDAPSPCSEWSARDVVGHVIAVQHAIVATIDGQRAPMNPMVDPGRHAGQDPAATWTVAVAAISAALDQPDVLDRIVQTWRGHVTVDEMIGYNVGDTTIHTWDLARALGVDDQLDADLVAASLAALEPVADAMRGPGVFGQAMFIDASADAQTRLLGLVGRNRQWSGRT